MNERVLIFAFSKILCKASCPGLCPFCVNGVCQKTFSDTFIPEATAIVEYLKTNELLKKAKLL